MFRYNYTASNLIRRLPRTFSTLETGHRSHSKVIAAHSMNTMENRIVVKPQSLARPYNVYNIFFILERARLIEEVCTQGSNVKSRQPSSSPVDFFGYDLLCLPDLPPRYRFLDLPPDWYVPGKNAKRKHVATNGREFRLELL
jgi:hypothetical protein